MQVTGGLLETVSNVDKCTTEMRYLSMNKLIKLTDTLLK